MRQTRAISLLGLLTLFFITSILGSLLTGCSLVGRAAYTPTPTKTPRSPQASSNVDSSFETPTVVVFSSPTEVAQVSTATNAPAEKDSPTPTQTPTATETFTPVPTPKPGEHLYTYTYADGDSNAGSH